MSKDLIENIRKLNRQNHLARGLASPNAEAPSYHGLLVEIQDRVSAQIQERVEKLASEFEGSWTPTASASAAAAAAAPVATPSTAAIDESIAELVLGVTALDRKIDSILADEERSATPSEALSAEDLAALIAKIDGLESRLDALPNHEEGAAWEPLHAAIAQLTEKVVPSLATTGDTDAPAAADSSALAELHAKLDEIEALVRASTPAESAGISLDELESVLEQQLSRWAEQIAPGPENTVATAAIESLDLSVIEQKLCEHLDQSLQNGAIESAPSDLASRLDAFEARFEERLDAILSNLGSNVAAEYGDEVESSDADVDADPERADVGDSAVLLARLEGLEEGLRSTIESFHERTTQTVLDRCLELEHSIPKGIEANLSEGHGSSDEGTNGSREVVDVVRSLVEGNALPTDLVELPDMVLHLRKDFSLLVHTINSHLEETRNLSNQVSRCVVEAMQDLEDSRPIPALDQALATLEQLRNLPAVVREEVQEALARSAADAPTDETTPHSETLPSAAPSSAAPNPAEPNSAAPTEELQSDDETTIVTAEALEPAELPDLSDLPDLPDSDSIEATLVDADLADLTVEDDERDPQAG